MPIRVTCHNAEELPPAQGTPHIAGGRREPPKGAAWSTAWRANTFQLSEPEELIGEHEQPFWPQPPTNYRTVSAMTLTATHEMPIGRAFSMNTGR